MPLALLDSVRRAEGSQGVNTYLNDKLCYMPTKNSKIRKQHINRFDALENVRSAIAFYLEEQQPFTVAELCQRANVSTSWLYRKGDLTVEALYNDVKAAMELLGKRKRNEPSKLSPPELELDKSAIARDWLDSQIEYYSQSVEALRQRREAITIELGLNQQQVDNITDRLKHLRKVRDLTHQELL